MWWVEGNLLFVEQTAPLRRATSHLLGAAHLLYEAAQLYNGGAPFIWSDAPFIWGGTLFMPNGLHRLALENHLLHGRRRETVSDNAQREGHTRRYRPRLLHSPLRRGYKKRPAVSHDRSLILLMVSDKRTRDVNSRMKIRSCATNDLRLPNEPLKSEFEIGCCKYSLFRSFHQNPNAFFSDTTEEISFLSLWAEKTLRF